MFDIAQQLFPNLMTILVQLCATGVIYVLYKKYLHLPVLKIMDKKAESFQAEYRDIEIMKQEQEQLFQQFNRERELQKQQLVDQKEKLLEEIDVLRQQRILEIKEESEHILNQAAISIAQERNEMLDDLEKHIIEVSTMLVEKVLEGYTFNESEILISLEKELENYHASS
ncbi:hypothetical protein AOC36_06960 [Erysipelothrix larvae]|uniref:ATP synthase subunit b n=1 Tax=Erysipelothrix larvae TaxID=1514105 RepID=A0A0X8H0D2_9FIRM|nr:ATP synthase F0 subunit B [Erysipelothrix larvae]AMC93731.1 hypothetical protein AOC36_06960 [Erysipelothrix larvae]